MSSFQVQVSLRLEKHWTQSTALWLMILSKSMYKCHYAKDPPGLPLFSQGQTNPVITMGFVHIHTEAIVEIIDEQARSP